MRRRLAVLVWLLGSFVSLTMSVAHAAEARRLALVIGNASYGTGKLPTAANDAGLIAQSLAQDGFDVTAMADADADTIRKTVDSFTGRAKAAGPEVIVFVYFTGYGAQYAGANFFVPIGAKTDQTSDMPAAVVALDAIEKQIQAVPATARLFVYDLARDSPTAETETSPFARGLAMVAAAPDTLVAFNASPGMSARGDVPPYGLYARALAEMLRTPGLPARGLFARVRLRIAEMTAGAVVPWDTAALRDDVVLMPGESADPGPVQGTPAQTAFWSALVQDTLPGYRTFLASFADDPLAARVRQIVTLRLEAATWQAAVRADTAPAYWTFMRRYPRGPHYVDVRRRLTALRTSLEPPPRFDLVDLGGLPAPMPEQLQAVEKPLPLPDAAERAALPPVPEALLPPPPPSVWSELPPPPLVPRGVLPVPTPFLLGSTRVSLDVPGRILQPFVPGIGAVTIQSRLLGTAAAMTLATDDGLVSRAVTASDKAGRTIVQTDAADEMLSRTTVVRDDGGTTITQTGPQGAVLAKIDMRDAQGARTTIFTNGADQLVAEVRTGPRGVIEAVRRGTGMADDGSFVLPAATGPRDALPVAKPALPPVETLGPTPPPLPDPTAPPPLPPSDLPAAAPPSSAPAAPVPAPAVVTPPVAVVPPEAPAAAPSPPAADVPQPVPRPPPNGTKAPRREPARRGHR